MPIKTAEGGKGGVVKTSAHSDADYEPRGDIGAEVRGKRETELTRSDRYRAQRQHRSAAMTFDRSPHARRDYRGYQEAEGQAARVASDWLCEDRRKVVG
jgi:hypothetical protein